MEIRELKSSGRTVMIQFECRRCKKKLYFDLSEMIDNNFYGHLHNTKLPAGWNDATAFGQLFCEECMEAYKAFIDLNSMEDAKDETCC